MLQPVGPAWNGRCCRWGVALAIVLSLSLSGRPAARAAEPPPLTEAERQAAYDDLAREAVAIEAYTGAIKHVVRLVRPTVVHIEVTKSGEPKAAISRRGGADETGSGVILKLDGGFYIVTNRHLIRDAEPENITVKLSDGRRLSPTRIWQDPGTDLAVMSLQGEHLAAARVGDSDRIEIGDIVLAIGSPFGLSHSVTHGIISAKGRRDLELATDGVSYQDFLQTDASINPGNSGGPLVNLRGEVVGINTAIASSSGHSEGIGFSIPMKMVMFVVRQLVEHGTVVRGFLGVSLDSKFSPAAATELGLDRLRGARITAVTPGSPAETARLQAGDVILEFNGVVIEDDSHLVNTVSQTEIGREVPVLIYRDRQTFRLQVKVVDRTNSGL